MSAIVRCTLQWVLGQCNGPLRPYELSLRPLSSCFEVGVLNYTVLRNVLGKSRRGEVSDDLAMTGLGGNIFMISYYMPDRAKEVVARIQPILNKFGGTCYISDAMEVRSLNCASSL